MTRWWWVRHGPTHQKSFTGWRDVPADLSDTAQIARLAEYLPKDAVVVASDLIRADQTAFAIQDQRQRLPNTAQLREFNFGEWDGVHFKVVSERDPDLSRAYWEQPGDVAPPGGESWNSASARICSEVERLTYENAGRDVIAVAHFGVILTQVQMAGRMTAYQALGHEIDNLSVTQTVFDGNTWQLGRINHVP